MRVRSRYIYINRGYIIIVKKLTILTLLSSLPLASITTGLPSPSMIAPSPTYMSPMTAPPTPRRQQVPGDHRNLARWGGDALAALGTTAYVLGLASWCATPRAVVGCSSDQRRHARLGG